MSYIGNIIWFLFGGFFQSVCWFLWGCIWSVTIIGIPIGKQCFKFAKLQWAPFGKEIITEDDGTFRFLANIVWLLTTGWTMCLANIIGAITMALTIVGIPFAVQSLKIAKLSLMPFGKKVI